MVLLNNFKYISVFFIILLIFMMFIRLDREFLFILGNLFWNEMHSIIDSVFY